MDNKQFTEFWGNAWLSMAKGQKQLTDMTSWFTGNLMDLQDMNKMFGKIYGMESIDKGIPDYFSWWERSVNLFQKSFQDLFSMMDFIPRSAYRELEKENEELKRKIAELERNMVPNSSILDEEIKLANEGIKGFQGLVQEQVRQYQELMDNIGKVFMANVTTSQTQKKTESGEPEKPPTSRKKSGSQSRRKTEE